MSGNAKNLRILPHGRIVVEGVKDAATRDVLRQMNDNIVALAREQEKLRKQQGGA